ncbi:MAG: hypothetical protein JWM05_578, partial [Acidimicrobiales bacterium]|nr:hypothetical protein [Acidimicrobiales bacterium]
HGPFGTSPVLFAALVQAVLGAATAGLGGFVARRLVSPRAGVVATFVLALYPNLVFHAGALLSETLYNLLFVAFLAVIVARPWPTGLTRPRIAAAMVLFALAVLVRPISLAVLPALVLCWWLAARDWRVVLRWTGVALGVLVLCVAPWTIRNSVRMHNVVAISTNTGDNLCIGHNADARGAFKLTERCNSGEGVQKGARSEVRNDRIKTGRALRWTAHHLGREPWLVYERAFYMFQHDHDGVLAVESYRLDWWIPRGTELTLFRVADTAYAVVALTGVVGLVRLARSRRPEAIFFVLATLATAAVPLAFFGDARFKVPVVALLCIAAGAAVGGRSAEAGSPAGAKGEAPES